MLTLLIFIIILGLLIFVHEFGHFLAARRAGVEVEEFGFGFPPRLFATKKIKGTVYSLNLLPLGGFVKIRGEGGEEKENPKSFASKKISWRVLILSAGVLMNLVLGIALLSAGFALGLPTAVGDEEAFGNAKVQISFLEKDSPAEEAGIKIGDQILALKSVRGETSEISKVSEVQNFVAENKGGEVILTLRRGQEVFSLKTTPRELSPEGQGPLGVALARVVLVSYPLDQAIWLGVKETFQLLILIFSALGALIWGVFSNGQLVADVAGPVGIFSITGQAAQMGFIYLLQLTALLSINLAVINILPFPALDGGRIFFLILEKIKGSPVSLKVEQAVHAAGFSLLILLMIVITLRDVARLF